MTNTQWRSYTYYKPKNRRGGILSVGYQDTTCLVAWVQVGVVVVVDSGVKYTLFFVRSCRWFGHPFALYLLVHIRSHSCPLKDYASPCYDYTLYNCNSISHHYLLHGWTACNVGPCFQRQNAISLESLQTVNFQLKLQRTSFKQIANFHRSKLGF